MLSNSKDLYTNKQVRWHSNERCGTPHVMEKPTRTYAQCTEECKPYENLDANISSTDLLNFKIHRALLNIITPIPYTDSTMLLSKWENESTFLLMHYYILL